MKEIRSKVWNERRMRRIDHGNSELGPPMGSLGRNHVPKDGRFMILPLACFEKVRQHADPMK